MQNQQLELTLKSILIGLVLAILFCGTNVYLGLKIGNTISASIPAAIVAMGFLRLFKKYSVLENSIAQTTASTGESAASVSIFVFPALLILGIANNFDYWNIVLVGTCGGLIGVVYSVILRKILLNDKSLSFPEGIAIGKVLSTTMTDPNGRTNKNNEIKALSGGIAIASIITFCQSGLQVLSSSYSKMVNLGNNQIIGGSISFSTAMIGAGYLVGFNPMFVALVSGIISWCVFLPIFTSMHGIQDSSDLVGSAFHTWQLYIRPIGIGVLVFGGLSTIILLAKPVIRGIRESLSALRNLTHFDSKDCDLNIKKLSAVLLLAAIPIFILIYQQLGYIMHGSVFINSAIAAVLVIFTLFVGFVLATVAGYFAGLIGSTNSPISGLLFIAVIAMSLIFKALMSIHSSDATIHLFTLIVMLVGFTGFSAVVTNGNVQDYKSGQIVGSTPFRQQQALFIGIVISVLVTPIFLNLIFYAYGIGGIVPHQGIDPRETLSAPQATAVAMIAKNIINETQDWNLIAFGFGIGLISLIIDNLGKNLKKKNPFRCPILAVGTGIYLPPDLVVALFIGGLMRAIINRKHAKMNHDTEAKEIVKSLDSKASLFVCGLIAGESIMGLALAVPFIIFGSSNALSVVSSGFSDMAGLLSVIVTSIVVWIIYRMATKK